MTACVAPLHPRPVAAFDPMAPAAERQAALLDGVPAPLRAVLAGGRVERRARFTDDGFDGTSERWSPPAVTAQQAALARRAVQDLEETVLAPAPANHLLARVLALLSHYPARGMSAEVEEMVALDWADDLGEFPAWAIDAAARTWRRTRKWRPSIAEMRALCEQACAAERALAARLRAVAEAGGTEAGPRTATVRTVVAGALRRMG